MKTACNPFLPLNAYIPDGEPHVYGDRLYLFGSHDQEGGDTFCVIPPSKTLCIVRNGPICTPRMWSRGMMGGSIFTIA